MPGRQKSKKKLKELNRANQSSTVISGGIEKETKVNKVAEAKEDKKFVRNKQFKKNFKKNQQQPNKFQQKLEKKEENSSEESNEQLGSNKSKRVSGIIDKRAVFVNGFPLSFTEEEIARHMDPPYGTQVRKVSIGVKRYLNTGKAIVEFKTKSKTAEVLANTEKYESLFGRKKLKIRERRFPRTIDVNSSNTPVSNQRSSLAQQNQKNQNDNNSNSDDDFDSDQDSSIEKDEIETIDDQSDDFSGDDEERKFKSLIKYGDEESEDEGPIVDDDGIIRVGGDYDDDDDMAADKELVVLSKSSESSEEEDQSDSDSSEDEKKSKKNKNNKNNKTNKNFGNNKNNKNNKFNPKNKKNNSNKQNKKNFKK